MSWSCPFHAVQPPLHVPDIFSVCPLHFPMYVPFFRRESFPYISRRADWFPCALFPFPSPCTPLFSFLSLACPFQFPFVSLACPAAFLSCRLPISSPHFLALPCISPLLPNISIKKHGFPAFSQLGRPNFRQKEAGTPTQQRAGRGNRAWDPCFVTLAPRRLRLVERHQIAARSLGGVGGLPGTNLRLRSARCMAQLLEELDEKSVNKNDDEHDGEKNMMINMMMKITL